MHRPHLLAAVGAQRAQNGQQLGGAAAAGPSRVLQHVLGDVVHLGCRGREGQDEVGMRSSRAWLLLFLVCGSAAGLRLAACRSPHCSHADVIVHQQPFCLQSCRSAPCRPLRSSRRAACSGAPHRPVCTAPAVRPAAAAPLTAAPAGRHGLTVGPRGPWLLQGDETRVARSSGGGVNSGSVGGERTGLQALGRNGRPWAALASNCEMVSGAGAGKGRPQALSGVREGAQGVR